SRGAARDGTGRQGNPLFPFGVLGRTRFNRSRVPSRPRRSISNLVDDTSDRGAHSRWLGCWTGGREIRKSVRGFHTGHRSPVSGGDIENGPPLIGVAPSGRLCCGLAGGSVR